MKSFKRETPKTKKEGWLCQPTPTKVLQEMHDVYVFFFPSQPLCRKVHSSSNLPCNLLRAQKESIAFCLKTWTSIQNSVFLVSECLDQRDSRQVTSQSPHVFLFLLLLVIWFSDEKGLDALNT